MLTEKQLQEWVDSLPLDELAGQVINYEIGKRHDREWVKQIIRDTKPGSIYYGRDDEELCQYIRDLQDEACSVPTMYVADVEHGPGCGAPIDQLLPVPMAWGAVNDPDLVEAAHHETAKMCRKYMRHLALSPVSDINFNFRNPLVNTRAVSDDTDAVIRLCAAAVRGFQKDGMMAACCKHFPGDGMDDRNQHFLTSINSLSKEEWMNTYGRVYKAMIDEGVMSIMVAHIALPAFDEKVDDILGYPPATLSKNLMTGLLKGTLGFDGCIVSDAMSMIGACAMVPAERLAVEYLKAGGDLILFALPTDHKYIIEAVESGDLPLERLKDAVLRIFRMKNKVGLFGEEEAIQAKLANDPLTAIEAMDQELADRSITVIRNARGLFPQKNLKPGAKILQVIVQIEETNGNNVNYRAMATVEEELKARGYEVTTLVNPKHYDVKDAVEKYDLVLLNCRVSSSNYQGGTLRLGWGQVMALWRGYLMQHPNLIFTSFGDPYKLYDYPFAHTYINTYSPTESSQRAFVKALFGEIEAVGKSPVAHEGFFERGI
ncbi:MAG: glycoside hydrolase family 3 protein [Clostridia bacterium]|nr:glycoside hydrolase family 3 protein [Clostridia bacterium]